MGGAIGCDVLMCVSFLNNGAWLARTPISSGARSARAEPYPQRVAGVRGNSSMVSIHEGRRSSSKRKGELTQLVQPSYEPTKRAPLMGQQNRREANRLSSASNSCGQCADGWICEEHPHRPWPHDDCSWPRMPCENPDCRYSIKKTGLVCPSCRRATRTIELQTNRVIGFSCEDCGYYWRAERGRVARQHRHWQ
jgi:hypothetical protein